MLNAHAGLLEMQISQSRLKTPGLFRKKQAKKTGSVFFEKQSAEDPSDVIGKAGYPISCVRWKLTGQIDKHGGSSKTSPDQSCQKLQLL